MTARTIGLIWAGGLVLALGLYATGPERFVTVLGQQIDLTAWRLHQAILAFGADAFEAMRALAIALFGVFLTLAILATRRGLRARGAMTAVSVLFLLLLAGPGSGTPIHPDRWLEAFVLAAIGSVVMTARLLGSR